MADDDDDDTPPAPAAAAAAAAAIDAPHYYDRQPADDDDAGYQYHVDPRGDQHQGDVDDWKRADADRPAPLAARLGVDDAAPQPPSPIADVYFLGNAVRRTSPAFRNASVNVGWLGSRVVSVLDSGAEGPGFKSQSRRCRVTVLGKLFTPIVPLFTKQQNW